MGRHTSSDPFDLIRYAAAFLLGAGTVVAVVLWLTGITPRALLLVAALWSVYGLIHAVLDGVLDPVVDLVTEMLHNIGLTPHRRSYSYIEAMLARGETDAAAAEYSVLAAKGEAQAQTRRAALLAGPLRLPQAARIELEEFREGRTLGAQDDIRIGLALADVYEKALDDPGRAMREIRRLLDRYPNARGLRHFRRTLAALKAERFGVPRDGAGPARP